MQQLLPTHVCSQALPSWQHSSRCWVIHTPLANISNNKGKTAVYKFPNSLRACSRISWSYSPCHRAEHKSNNSQLLPNGNFSLNPVEKQGKPVHSSKCKSMFGLLHCWSVWGFFQSVKISPVVYYTKAKIQFLQLLLCCTQLLFSVTSHLSTSPTQPCISKTQTRTPNPMSSSWPS